MIYSYQSLEDEFKDKEEQPWVWALVCNAVEEHEFGEEHEIKRWTKHFFPGAKTYVAPPQWGDGFENVVVIGRYRLDITINLNRYSWKENNLQTLDYKGFIVLRY